MPSESIILELLKQAQEDRNRPSQTRQTIAQLSQTMEGVLKGIQLFDAAKSLGLKFGTTETVKEAVAGKPGVRATDALDISALAPQESLRGSSFLTRPEFSDPGKSTILNLLASGSAPRNAPDFPTPSMSPAISLAATPGRESIPPQPAVTRQIPGAAQLAMIKAAKDISPTAGRETSEKLLGRDIVGTTIEEQKLSQMTPVIDPETGKIAYYVPKGSKFEPQTDTVVQFTDPKTGDVVRSMKVAKGTQTKSLSTTGQTPEEKLRDIVASVEDDARASVSEFLPEKEKKIAVQNEFARILLSRAQGFPLKDVARVVKTRFGGELPKFFQEALNFADQNSTQVEAHKQKVKSWKTQGVWDSYRPLFEEKLISLGYPQIVIDDIFLSE